MHLSNASITKERFSLDGKHISWWINAFNICFSQIETDIIFECWPDGGCYLDQDNVEVMIFEKIREAHLDNIREQIRKLTIKNRSRGNV